MGKTRSARGQIVDFDLLKIKQALVTQADKVDVKAKSNFLDRRLSKKLAKAVPPKAKTVEDQPVVTKKTKAVEKQEQPTTDQT